MSRRSKAERQRLRERACTRKQRWQSDNVATNVATALAWAGRGVGTAAYKCPYCPYWHIGHPHKRPADA